MRNRLVITVLTFLVLSLASLNVRAQGGGVLSPQVQTGFLIGPIGGINLVAYNTGTFPILNSEPTCFQAQNGSDIAPWGGLSLELPLGNAQELQNFIVAEVIYDSKSSKFTSLSGAAVSTPTKLNGFVGDNSSVNTSIAARLSYLVVNLAYKYNFTPGPTPVGPGLQVGPSVGIKMGATFDKTVTVTAISPTATANNDMATATVTSSTAVDGASGIRLALRAQATYDIPFTQEWIATPTVGYDFPITKVDNTSRDWHASSVFGGITFRYYIRG
jgi:hypothetical protein